LVDKETMIEPKEVEKYSDVNNTIMDKGISTELVKLTTQKDANRTILKRSSNVELQTS
jgi:predicted mannosyl-3-phosphoglycerate phosphatase (HAD superfamily)